MHETIKLLLIGTLPPPEGGQTLLVKMLAEDLNNSGRVNVTLVDLKIRNKLVPLLPIIMFWKIVQVLIKVKKADVVSFQTPANYLLPVGTLVALICRFCRKPLILRRFAGYYDEFYLSYSQITKAILRNTILNANLVLFETIHQVRFFSNVCRNEVKWFPNYRRIPHDLVQNKSKAAKRFVYVGEVSREKGIYILLDAVAPFADSNFTLSIYGRDKMDIINEIFDLPHVYYHGVLDNDKVIGKLTEYDVLILPSFREGYPGIIIESFIAGIPVIASALPAIEELITNRKNGLLFRVGDVKELQNCISELLTNEKLYLSIKRNSANSGSQFSNNKWTEFFINELENQVSKR